MGGLRLGEALEQNYRDYYAAGISTWRNLGASNKARNVMSLCGDLDHASILEIGAGEGAVLQRLSESDFGESLYALEISPSGVEAIAARQIPNLVECKLYDGYSIPYPDNTFDLAILCHVLEHVEHPRQLLHEAARVARRVFIEVPTEDTLRLGNDFVRDRVGHINFYSPKTIRLLVQSCDMTILHQVTTNLSKEMYVRERGRKGMARYYVKQILLKIAPGVGTELFTYHEALVAEKDRSLDASTDTCESAGV